MVQAAQGTLGLVTWASARCELIPRWGAALFIASGDVRKLLEAAHWLIRLRLGNELLILNNVDAAALFAADDADYARLMAKLPRWLLFFNLGAYKYFPDMRMQGQIQDTLELMQRLSLQTAQAQAGSAQASSWKPSAGLLPTVLETAPRRRGEDIFFITTYSKIPGQIQAMTEAAEAAGYTAIGPLPPADRPGRQLPCGVQPLL